MVTLFTLTPALIVFTAMRPYFELREQQQMKHALESRLRKIWLRQKG